MMKIHLKFTWVLLFTLLFSGSSWALDLACPHLVPIQQRFLSRHVTYSKLNRNLEVKTVDQFIKHLDPSKIYFTQADVNGIKKSMNGIFNKTKKGDCSAILAAYALLKTRVKENVDLAKAYLGKDFKFNPKTKLILDSKKRSFAKDKKAVQEFQKKYIQLQVANYIATDVKEEEARKKVLKNYERSAKKMEEDKTDDVLSNYLDSFASALDPHSTYWSKDAFEEFEISIRLSLEGIGATLSSKDGFTTIEQLIPGGSAAKSGLLQAKDKIVGVAQGEEGEFEDVIDQELRDVVKRIRGKKGTKVRLKILRQADKGTKNFEITLVRDKINIEDEAASISYHEREINGKKFKIGLLNLPSFYSDNRALGKSSASDMKKILREVRDQNVDALVLDLSSNGGGSLQDAVEIAGLFFREGNVVKQSSRDPNGQVTLFDKDPIVDYAGPLVILTSRVTASASEIVSGTLKDYKRAVIVGADHTFGKGTVQAVEDLPQKLGALKTTIGLYFIPGGYSTQHIGVVSDIELPSALSTEDIGEKTLDYSLPQKKLKPFLSGEAYVPSGPGKWNLIDKKTIEKLKSSSALRVAKSEDFKKVKKDIAKNNARDKNGEIEIGDFLKDREDSTKEFKEDEGKTYEESKVARKERYLKLGDILEAMDIAAELAFLEGKGADLKIGAKETGKIGGSQVNPKSNN
ncbi:MAG: carboxy terminal-processing peptidase [Bdellovibrionales bacterium]|nr:carboxy terminal-processing peptidase [Bdellovibrionales bacterium]